MIFVWFECLVLVWLGYVLTPDAALFVPILATFVVTLIATVLIWTLNSRRPSVGDYSPSLKERAAKAAAIVRSWSEDKRRWALQTITIRKGKTDD